MSVLVFILISGGCLALLAGSASRTTGEVTKEETGDRARSASTSETYTPNGGDCPNAKRIGQSRRTGEGSTKYFNVDSGQFLVHWSIRTVSLAPFIAWR